MHVFVTGGSGFIGSAVVPELLGAGHTVVGLARSDASAERLAAAGADVLRGELADLDVLRRGASEADGTIHLGFVHDFANFAAAGVTDATAITAMAEALEGTGKALVTASGVLGLPAGRVVTERDEPAQAHRATALAFAGRGVRASAVRLAPTVHGAGDHGFVPALIGIAQRQGVSATIGDGRNTWPAVHRSDAARLFRLAVESAPAGSTLHATAEEGVETRAIAEAIGRHLGLPVTAVEPGAAAEEHFGWMARMFAMDVRASHALTSELLGWEPTGPGLLQDLDEAYFTPQA
ncbi:SDR family oxidoreductase [Microlunatus flavus]|uniref:Nucleoside-diphosphate-sugar epimerase n=1 Tax=Microlunatus flavus TaxID=1036181 RepID=A0A1H8ZG18_9ACTN|nr:SDR family oxidoreductase [Microlunatus flavus]SEP63314.1 Nucleoside-diphosphate-sugar epimerase [Microlunatus flavus]